MQVAVSSFEDAARCETDLVAVDKRSFVCNRLLHPLPHLLSERSVAIYLLWSEKLSVENSFATNSLAVGNGTSTDST